MASHKRVTQQKRRAHRISNRRFLPGHLQHTIGLVRDLSNLTEALHIQAGKSTILFICFTSLAAKNRRTSHHVLIASSARASATGSPLTSSFFGLPPPSRLVVPIEDFPLATLPNESLLRLIFFQSRLGLPPSVPVPALPSTSVSYTNERFERLALRLGVVGGGKLR